MDCAATRSPWVGFSDTWEALFCLVPVAVLKSWDLNCSEASQAPRVDCKKLEHGPRTIHDGCLSFLGFGVGGWSYSNFLASAV